MKSAGDPYECFRWKSSCGRLVVRTAWVKGVRHVILSDEDSRDKHRDQDSTSAGPEKEKRDSKFLAKPAPFTGSDIPPSLTCGGGGEDDCYAERVLRWLQKPTETTCRKLMSAPPDGNHRHPQPDLQLPVRYQQLDVHRSDARRPALIKTCSIPENSRRLLDGDVRRPVKNVTEVKRPTKSITHQNRKGNTKNHNFKTELHVHLPSMCSGISTKYDQGSKVDDDDDDCYYLPIL